MSTVHKYKLAKITHETHNTFSWQLHPQEQEDFNFQSGQFAMIHILNDDGGTRAKKPYSLASSPLNNDYLEFGIKLHGDFTHQLSELKAGEIVGIEGPYGVFTYDKDKHQDCVMLAGGIGITPFISMIKYASQAAPENKIILYYFNQTEKDVAFQENLAKLDKQNSNLKIIYSVDKALTDSWTGEVGLISQENMKKNLDDLQSHFYFLCGPGPFMKAAEAILQANQVPIEQIKKEVF